MEEKKSNYLQDNNGNKSSKRFFGAILLTVAIAQSLIFFWYSLDAPVGDATAIRDVIGLFLGAGSSLLGIGVFEKKLGK